MCGDLRIGAQVLKQPAVCAAVRAPTVSKMQKLAKRALSSGADLVELRIDSLRNLDGWKKCLNLKAPVILTNRPVREGGGFEGSEEKRIEILLEGISRGVDCVDIEFSTKPSLVKRVLSAPKDTSIILSYHDFSKTPSVASLVRLVGRMERERCDLIKIVTMARNVRDNFQILDFLISCKGSMKHPLVAFTMGEVGMPTRFIGTILGVPIIYAAAERRTAPGQLTVEETKQILQRIPAWEVKG